MIKKLFKRLLKREGGQALPMVLILMVVGGLILTPLLSHTSSNLIVGTTYERIADEFYAADAGIEDGLWHINYDQLDDVFTSPDYEKYNYSTIYQYPLSYPLEVNDIDVVVKIKNIWIPKDKDPLSPSQAEQLIRTGKLIIAGSVPEDKTYQVKVYYYPEPTDGDLTVTKIGVWVPPGFHYNEDGECSLETWLEDNYYDYSRQISNHQGGQAIVWNILDAITFENLPGVDPSATPLTFSFTFKFEPDDSESDRSPEAVSWIFTSGVEGVDFTWDADVRVFHINSTAGGEDGTVIDAYAIKTDLRQLISGRSGDYRAIGNTMMENQETDPWWSGPVRDTLLGESNATADDIPDNANVELALLYWSGWVLGEEEIELFYDNCNGDIYEYWYPVGDDWSQEGWWGSYYYAAHHSYGNGDDDRELVLREPVSLSDYPSGTVELSLDYRLESNNIEYNDCLRYAFYNNDGWSAWYDIFCDDGYGGASTSWRTFTVTVPDDYLTADFKVKFQIVGFEGSGWGGNETCYIDDITVTAEDATIADTTCTFEIDGDPYHLEEDEYGKYTIPAEGAGLIHAEHSQSTSCYPSPGYMYCCRADITPLIQEYTENGNAPYTVGGVYGDVDSEWSYAGWSMIIMFSSPETLRQQLYLFDLANTDNYEDLLYIAPQSNGENFTISGFLVPEPIPGEENAAKMTVYVGDGDEFYSGDFIAINAPEVEHGSQVPDSYKLWDRVTLGPSGYSPNMSNNEDSPNNVWNGRSAESGGTFIDGVDIDTFYIPWGDPPSEGLIKPEDSAATISLNFAGTTGTAELISFLYLVISFRSDVVIGGTVTYLIDMPN
jgi:hypothetical protein